MTDLEKAKEILQTENIELVFVRGKFIYKRKTFDIKDLIDIINDNSTDFEETSVAISKCSRAHAFLLVVLDIKEVFTPKMTKLATQILDRAQIKYTATEYVEKLDNFIYDDVVLRSGSPLNALNDLENFINK